MNKIIALLLLLAGFTVVQAQTVTVQDPVVGFAALSVTSFGEQQLDAETGIVTLPEGGEFVIPESGITLSGESARFQEGEFIEVDAATLTGPFGRITANRIYVDFGAQTLKAEGEVQYNSSASAVSLSAENMLIYLDQQIGVLRGGVLGQNPELSTATMVVDTANGQALLSGLFEYRNKDAERGYKGTGVEKLLVTWATTGGEVAFEASSDIPADVLERLSSYLER